MSVLARASQFFRSIIRIAHVLQLGMASRVYLMALGAPVLADV
jgi:hypothetical protein